MNEALRSGLSHFDQQNGEIIVGGRPISQIAEEYGTPLYIYDRSVMHWRHQSLRNALPRDLEIHYAVKANPHGEVIQELGNLYDGIDIASKGEMVKVLEAGIAPEKISFAGPGKSIDELRFAVSEGIGSISVESEREVEHIRAICRDLRRRVKILIRVNPDFELASSGMKMGGGPKQFGIDSERVPQLLGELRGEEWVEPAGIHIFAGSQNLNAEAILETFQKIMDYAVSLKTDVSFPLQLVNLGGGFGIPYFSRDRDLDLARVGDGLGRLIDTYGGKLPETQFRIELGRYIVGESGLYVCKVLYRKVSRGQIFLIANGGMNHHLAASGNLGQSLARRPFALTVANRLGSPTEKVNVVGPLCTPIDSFGTRVELPRADEGDLIAIMNSGAYGYSTSPLGFLSHQPPREILV